MPVPVSGAVLSATLLLASVGVAWFGLAAAAAESRSLREAESRRALLDLSAEAEAGASRFRSALDATRGGDLSGVPFPLSLRSVSRRPAPLVARSPDLEVAEWLEFEERDSGAAFDRYRDLATSDRPASVRAPAMRNLARIHFARGEHDEAVALLWQTVGLERAPSREVLLARLDLARAGDPAAGPSLVRDLRGGAFPDVPPLDRSLVLSILGDAGEDAAALQALAQLEDAGMPDRPVRAGDGWIAWLLRSEEGEVRLALATSDTLVASLLPGVASGRWLLSPEGDGHPLPLPFPGLAVRSSPEALAARDEAAREVLLRRMVPAAVVAAVLAAAALLSLRHALARALLDRRKNDFVCAVTHELKTPVANILLYADTIREHAADDPERVSGFAGVVAGEALRLQSRVQEVLDVASGRRVVGGSSAGFHAAAEAGRVCAEFRDRAAAMGMDISLEGTWSGLSACGSPDLFRRALAGLLDNSLKYARRGVVRVSLGGIEGRVQVVVEDEGPGVPSGERERVFEPFTRLGAEMADRVPGTGLGLAIARTCVAECGGTVRAEAAAGGGARFVIEIPEADRGHHPGR